MKNKKPDILQALAPKINATLASSCQFSTLSKQTDSLKHRQWLQKTINHLVKSSSLGGKLFHAVNSVSPSSCATNNSSDHPYADGNAPAAARALLCNWQDTRIEALSCLWLHGAADAKLLATRDQQNALLDYYFRAKPHQEIPLLANMQPYHDSFQAIYRAYSVLDEQECRLGDQARRRFLGSPNTLYGDFDKALRKLSKQWKREWRRQSPLDGDRMPPQKPPKTLLDLIYGDVTQQSKSLAFSRVFGPSYPHTISWAQDRLQQYERHSTTLDTILKQQLREFNRNLKNLLEAKEPQHVV